MNTNKKEDLEYWSKLFQLAKNIRFSKLKNVSATTPIATGEGEVVEEEEEEYAYRQSKKRLKII